MKLAQWFVVHKTLEGGNKELTLPRAASPRSRLSPLVAVIPVDLAPVRPWLENQEGRRPRASRGGLPQALLLIFALLFCLIATLCGLGLQRAEHARQLFRLAQQIRLQEQENQRVRRDFQRAKSEAAVQAAQLQTLRLTVPAAPGPAQVHLRQNARPAPKLNQI
jgi:hypothetical protein